MKRLPLVLSATALVVAVFGSTPVGHAVGSAIPAFAKSAGYAKQAGNASALNGIKASKQPGPACSCPSAPTEVPRLRRASAGPAGPKGDKGDKGATGPSWAGRSEGRHRTGGPRRCGAGLAGRAGSAAGSTSRRGSNIPPESGRTWPVNCPRRARKRSAAAWRRHAERVQDAHEGHRERARRRGDGMVRRPSSTTPECGHHVLALTSGRSART